MYRFTRRTLAPSVRHVALAPVALALAAFAAPIHAQQSRTPPAPRSTPLPPTPPSPRAAPAPWPEAMARSMEEARMAMEEARLMSGQHLDALRLDALRDMNLARDVIAPRALMESEMAAMRAGVEAARLGTAIGAQASAMAARAVDQALTAELSGQLALAAPMAFSVSGFGSSYRTQPRAAWDAQDLADSLYREARRALGNDNYPMAALIFKRIRDEYPKSTYTPDAYYWEAFAMHRIALKETGSQKASLNGALEVLALQQQRFPRASTRGDAIALRTRIEGQLARLGDAQAIANLSDRARNATSDGCPNPKEDERIDALNALAQMDAEQAMPLLKRVLTRREACTQHLRRTAVWLIASKKQPEAAAILLDVAKTDPDKEVREQAVFWISNVPTDEAIGMLVDLAKKGDDLDLQKRAVYSLSRSKSPRAASTLREIALDANADESLRADALS